MGDSDFQSWHDAERAVRDLEQRLLIAQAPRVAAAAAIVQDLQDRLDRARVAADQALSECLRGLTRQRRRHRVAAVASRGSSPGADGG